MVKEAVNNGLFTVLLDLLDFSSRITVEAMNNTMKKPGYYEQPSKRLILILRTIKNRLHKNRNKGYRIKSDGAFLGHLWEQILNFASL